ncbi:MAG: PsbP-related protein, partial [Chloroflexota bacterium]
STESSSTNLDRTFESNAFSFDYPSDWQYQIPQMNMLFLASPQVLVQEAGATMTVQRSIGVTTQAESLADAMSFYLERGPLRSDRAWEMTSEIEATTLDTYDAVRVTVEGAEQIGTQEMRSYIILLQADSRYTFIFTSTAPIDQWDAVEPTFDAILASVDILE